MPGRGVVSLTLTRADDRPCWRSPTTASGSIRTRRGRRPGSGHFGLRLLADLAAGHGATLKLATAPGAGTRWRMELPL